jgi:hypothetical protein
MQLSIHYYVLSLNDQTCRLYEGFRDKLIDIQDTNFPVNSAMMDAQNPTTPNSKDSPLKDFFHQVDQRFTFYYRQDPLRLVVVGKLSNLAVFKTVTTHPDAILGAIKGDYTATSSHDLGMIVWPVVKEAIAGANGNAMHDLAEAARLKTIVSGIEAIGQAMKTETNSTLYVEEDYHVRGALHITDHSLIVSKHVNLWDVIDDVVDVIIERVLKLGGTVIFLKSESLKKFKKIALIPSGSLPNSNRNNKNRNNP